MSVSQGDNRVGRDSIVNRRQMQMYVIPSERTTVRPRDIDVQVCTPPFRLSRGVYPFMHERSRARGDNDARSRGMRLLSSVTSRRDPGLEPNSCPARGGEGHDPRLLFFLAPCSRNIYGLTWARHLRRRRGECFARHHCWSASGFGALAFDELATAPIVVAPPMPRPDYLQAVTDPPARDGLHPCHGARAAACGGYFLQPGLLSAPVFKHASMERRSEPVGDQQRL